MEVRETPVVNICAVSIITSVALSPMLSRGDRLRDTWSNNNNNIYMFMCDYG